MGVVALVVGFVFVASMFVWGVEHKHGIEVAVFAGAIGYIAYALRERLRELSHRVRGIDPTAGPVPLADVKAGPTHTAGLVTIDGEPKHAPLGAPPCVFYRIVIERVDAPHALVFEGRSADEIVLDDGMGAKLTVHLDGVTWLVTRAHEVVPTAETPDHDIARYLAERGVVTEHAVRARVEWIAPHELVFVRGIARELAPSGGDGGYRASAESAHLEMAATKDAPVFIALEAIAAGKS